MCIQKVFTAFAKYFVEALLAAIAASSLLFLVNQHSLFNLVELEMLYSHFQTGSFPLAGLLKDICRAVPKPLLCHLGFVLRVVVLLEESCFAQSSPELLGAHYHPGCLCILHIHSFKFLLLKNIPQHDAATILLLSSNFISSDQRIWFLMV